MEITFNEDSVLAKDFAAESKINNTEIKELIEIKNYFFIKLASGLSFIVPKHAIQNRDEFIKKMSDLGAAYVNDLVWKWQ